MTSTSRSVPRPAAPSPWVYVVAAPIVLLAVYALATDPGLLGERSDAADMTLPAFLVIAPLMTALICGVWALSRFRHRAVVAVFQVAIVWVGGLLYVFGARSHVSAWDLVESGVLLVGTLLQLLRGSRNRPM